MLWVLGVGLLAQEGLITYLIEKTKLTHDQSIRGMSPSTKKRTVNRKMFNGLQEPVVDRWASQNQRKEILNGTNRSSWGEIFEGGNERSTLEKKGKMETLQPSL